MRTTFFFFFFFNDPATTEIYTLSLHDALPISLPARREPRRPAGDEAGLRRRPATDVAHAGAPNHSASTAVGAGGASGDRKSTRLNSSHANISYAVFCLKKKKQHLRRQ